VTSSLPTPPRPAIFLDRDDTIIDNARATAHTAHPGDLLDPALVRFLPGAGPAMALLHSTGLPLVVVTNQGGIAQGFATLADVEAVNDRLRQLLRPMGVRLAGVYLSPARRDSVVARFNPPANDPRPWRKPGPGMLFAAAAELNLDLANSWMIGDAPRDIDAALAAGLAPKRCLQIGQNAPFPDLPAAAILIKRATLATTI
jgi:D-glycero-D-manno-heptose 1,7-bisphosphate phosphatase